MDIGHHQVGSFISKLSSVGSPFDTVFLLVTAVDGTHLTVAAGLAKGDHWVPVVSSTVPWFAASFAPVSYIDVGLVTSVIFR